MLAGLVAWALVRFWRIAAIGAAYKAKVLSSIIFGTGRTIDLWRAEEVHADSYWPLRLIRSRVDPAARVVTASFFGLRSRSAIYRAGLGATLLDRRPDRWPERGPERRPPERWTELQLGRSLPAIPWPTGEGSPALKSVVDWAFTEPNRKRLRRTRAVLVVRDGRIVAERYAPGFGVDTPFPGWSMTKSVLGALIGVLVGEGRLNLQDVALLPEWQAPDPRSRITLEDLLRMRSGLSFSEVYSDLTSDVIEMLFNRSDCAAYAASQKLSARPGETWSYSSGTTNILSRIARRVVGEAEYISWPRRVLFDPIGMSSAVFEPDGSGTFVGSSFMLATARDWARFGQLYLEDGVSEGRRVVPDGWVRFSTSPTPQSPDGLYGAHWWLKLQPEIGGGTRAATRIPADAFFAVGHEGQTLTVIPSQRLVVVRLGLSIYVDAWNHAAFIADLKDAL